MSLTTDIAGAVAVEMMLEERKVRMVKAIRTTTEKVVAMAAAARVAATEAMAMRVSTMTEVQAVMKAAKATAVLTMTAAMTAVMRAVTMAASSTIAEMTLLVAARSETKAAREVTKKGGGGRGDLAPHSTYERRRI
jgi:alanyl-tRNA synthetase